MMQLLRIAIILSLAIFATSSFSALSAADINSGGVGNYDASSPNPKAPYYWSVYGTNLTEYTGPPYGSGFPTARTIFTSCGSSNTQNYNLQSGPGNYWYESPLQINFWAVSSCSAGSGRTGRVTVCGGVGGVCDFEDLVFTKL